MDIDTVLSKAFPQQGALVSIMMAIRNEHGWSHGWIDTLSADTKSGVRGAPA
jgi:hypothetical protein